MRDNTRGARHRDRARMKTPVVLVTLMLATAILLAASLLFVTGTRSEDTPGPIEVAPASWIVRMPPGK